MSSHLTAAERETIIRFSDGDATATISTHQRKVITKLEKNPLAVKVADLTHGSTAGATFEIPAWTISFRTTRRKGGPGNPKAFARHPRHENEATSPQEGHAIDEGNASGSPAVDSGEMTPDAT